jgi:hypothetical protein
MPKFLCLIGMNYAQKRVEPGEIVSDVPKQSIPWLVEQGVIKEVTEEPAAEPQPTITEE